MPTVQVRWPDGNIERTYRRKGETLDVGPKLRGEPVRVTEVGGVTVRVWVDDPLDVSLVPMGRPVEGEAPKRAMFTMKVAEEDKAAWAWRAEYEGYPSTSAWATERLNEACVEDLPDEDEDERE